LQRLRLARGLLADSSILLLDEPFTGIDNATKRRIISFLIEYTRDAALLLVSHDKEEYDLCGIPITYALENGILTASVAAGEENRL
jgi:ABC-type Mn2+/Zn2+ transport system ATPase subunit